MASCLLFLLLVSLVHPSLHLCVCLSDEGRALLRFREGVEVDPFGSLLNWVGEDLDLCSWFGVECSDDGRVVALNLKDLCLEGTLAPELGKLTHMESLILHNNSFYGIIPKEIEQLPMLEVLDLGHNNFTGPLPSNHQSISSRKFLALRGTKFMDIASPESHKLNMLSKLQIVYDFLSSKKGAVARNGEGATIRKLLQLINEDKSGHHKQGRHHRAAHARPPSPSPLPSPSDSPVVSPSPHITPTLSPALSPENELSSPVPSPRTFVAAPTATSLSTPTTTGMSSSPGQHTASWPVYASVATAATFLLALSAVFFICCRTNKAVIVRPWSTGLSGQLRKAFVTGVPSLKRSEVEVACEDFSNIIGYLSNCILYKGTLSSGVEIAVTSSPITSSKDWSKEYEAQFRKKISVLSKVNHKNFVNLLGFCEEEDPFTRMMVFEYAPNGTLFEHLHIREAEHLDWAARLRIAMGIAYCLEHMHQLDAPVILRNLDSSSIYLTDDFAAKISDLMFWTETKEVEASSDDPSFFDSEVSSSKGIVYRFGIILLEMLSGRRPFSEDNGLLVLWASSYLNGQRPLTGMVDPTLESFHEQQVSALCDVIRSCINPDPQQRPKMSEIVCQLREVTAMPPDGAAPKLSPLWWAELEIISAEAS